MNDKPQRIVQQEDVYTAALAEGGEREWQQTCLWDEPTGRLLARVFPEYDEIFVTMEVFTADGETIEMRFRTKLHALDFYACHIGDAVIEILPIKEVKW